MPFLPTFTMGQEERTVNTSIPLSLRFTWTKDFLVSPTAEDVGNNLQ